MATYFRMFDAGEQWLDASGDPYSGGKLYLDDAGTSTNRTSYKDNAGAVAHTNPIVLDSSGRIPSGNNAWVVAGDVKVILHDSADVLIFTQDDYVAQGDNSAAGDGEWVASDLVPTRTANTIFTLPGDNTAIFHVGRRLKLVDSTTVYATITVSAYTSLTTLTVVVDGGTALTASLASLSYSLLSADNTSDPGRPRNLTMVNDGAVIKFGVNSDVTLTHVHDTGLLLNSTMTATSFDPTGDTSVGDNAAIGYHSSRGLILTGQGSNNDITVKNDAATTVLNVPTGGTDVEVSAGNLLFGTAAKGAYLGVTSATAANLLDDYEEGTFTGTFIGASSAPSTAVTATGVYTKIGNFVNASVYFGNKNTTGISGAIQVTGMPFVNSGYITVGTYLSSYMHSSGASASTAYLTAGGGTVQMLYARDNNIWATVTSRVSTAGYFILNMGYSTA
jgi:hypothetical protein